MTQRRLLSTAATLVLASFLSLLVYGLLSAGGGGSLAREIADAKLPATPRIDLMLLYPPRSDWKPRDRGILADSRVRTRELVGMPALINIWASWCIPCREEAPVLEQAAVGHPNVRFIGVNVRDANTEAVAFLRRYQITYPNLDDPDDQAWHAFQVTGVPESFLVDARGRLVSHTVGPFTTSSIERALSGIER